VIGTGESNLFLRVLAEQAYLVAAAWFAENCLEALVICGQDRASSSVLFLFLSFCVVFSY